MHAEVSAKFPPRFYDSGLDVVRFLAMLLVFTHHVFSRWLISPATSAPMAETSWLGMVVRLYAMGGGLGVVMFYTLSAYLLCKLFVIEHEVTHGVNLRQFWMRRCLRIWPLYFFYLGLLAVLQMIGTLPLPAFPGGMKTTALFTFVFNWVGWQPGTPTSLGGILWSVCVEEQFYFLLIVSVGCFGVKYLPVVGACLIVLGMGSRAVVVAWDLPYPAVWMVTTSHLDAFGVGILAAWWLHGHRFEIGRGHRMSLVMGAIASPAILATVLGPGIYSGGVAVATYFWTALTTVGLIVALAKRGPTTKSPGWFRPAIVYLGRRAYGLYVYHWLALGLYPVLLRLWGREAINGLDVVLIATTTVLCAVVSYELLEKPFLKLKRLFSAVVSAPTG